MNPVATASYRGIDQRASPRTDVYARLPMTLPDGRSVIVTLVNISADGMLVRHDNPLSDGDSITVSLPVIGKVKGRAVWTVGGRSGLQFDETIDARDYIPVLRAFGVKPQDLG